MNRTRQLWILNLCGMVIFVSSCAEVAITGRKQLNLVPDSMVHSMSFQSYQEFLKTNKISTNAEQTKLVKQVGGNLQRAVEKYCAENGMSDKLDGYQWEFNLIDDAAVNAWAMPGGKVVVYTGILPVTQTEAGLAVVMGHEIAHNIARHGNERMSQALLLDMGGMALSQAMTNSPDKTKELFSRSYEIGTHYGILLPYSRIQETEADRLGLIFMAMAGYKPDEAIGFWQRMAAQKKGASPPEFLSTHPADETRIENIRSFIPEAMQYYR